MGYDPVEIPVEFFDNSDSITVEFESNGELNADFGSVQTVVVGEVSASVAQTEEGAVITVTSDGVKSTATVLHGRDGKDGMDGKDGTPCTHKWNGTTLTVTSASGTSSANLKGDKGDTGATGAKGDKGAYGIKIGYPSRKGGTKEKINASRRLAECIAEEQKKIYYAPGRVSTNGNWDFDELNKTCCPSVYIEGCYANSNKKDAQWWHNNMDAIAMSYADALETWTEVMTIAY